MPVRDILNAASGAAAPADPYFYDVSLLLNGDGTNGAQNNTFLDSSSNAFTITRNGNTTQGSFSPYGTLWSNYFDGNSANLVFSPNSAYNFGSNDFCFEAFINLSRQTNTYAQGIISYGQGGSLGSSTISFQVSNLGYLQIAYATGALSIITSATLVPVGVWTHVAVCRTGSNLSIFQNGTRVATTITADTVGNGGTIYVGRQWYANDPARQLQGYISNARVTNGSSPYNAGSSSITVPTSPLTAITNCVLLTSQSNRFIDNSSTANNPTLEGAPSVQRFSPFNPTAPYDTATIGGSGYFNSATSDYLETASSSTLTLGTGNWTVECWVYPTSSAANLGIFGTGNATGCVEFYTSGSNGVTYNFFGGSGTTNTYNSTLYANQWNHVALTRSSGNFYISINGLTNSAQAAGGSDTAPGTVFDIGQAKASRGWYFPGYITDFRATIGTALYTGSYTVPTAPLAPVANTQLLTNMTNAGIPDLAMQNDLQTVGSAQVSTSVKKYGTGSLSFNGSNSYLTTPLVASDGFGTGSFTIECWLYLNSLKNYNTVFDMRNGNGVYPCITISSGGNIYWFINSTIVIDSGASAISTGSWTHIAVCRSGTSTKLFVNGTQAGSTYSDSNNYLNSNVHIGAGESSNPPAGNYLDGYVDDLRVTNGYARYTTTFTPPTSALPTY